MKYANHLPTTLFTFLRSSTRKLVLLSPPGNTNCNVHKVGRWKKILKMALACTRKQEVFSVECLRIICIHYSAVCP